MSSGERRIVNWLYNHAYGLALVLFSIFGLVIRKYFLYFESTDAKCFLLPWYSEIDGLTVKEALNTQVGNYGMLYQLIIMLLTHLNIEPLIAYKAVSIIFDYGLAVCGYVLVFSLKKDKDLSALAYGLILLNPSVFLNSSCWGQCDSIYTFWLMLTIVLLVYEKPGCALASYGIALSFKLQAIFILPALLLFYLVSKRFSFWKFVFIPLSMLLMALPNILAGRSALALLSIYHDQTENNLNIQNNYPSFWCLITNPDRSGDSVIPLKNAAILMTVAVLTGMYIFWMHKKIKWSLQFACEAAFITCYTCVLFLPFMHERYGFFCDAMGIILIFLVHKTVFPWCALIIQSCLIYGNFLFEAGYEINWVSSAINCIIYLSYLWFINKDLIRYSEPLNIANECADDK